jgi:hypothetical protein
MAKANKRAAQPSPVAVYLFELAEGSKRTMRFAQERSCWSAVPAAGPSPRAAPPCQWKAI